jgi:hypothetical protein
MVPVCSPFEPINCSESMKSIFRIIGAATVVLALTQSIQAVPITGSLNFTGQAVLNSSSVNTATAETSWVGPFLTGNSSGSFSGIASNSPVLMAIYTWSFNTPSASVSGFWSVGGFSFQLQSSHIASQGGGSLSVSALGMVTATGFDPTLMQWNFSARDAGSSPPTFAWSATTMNVPDGGATVMLLGIALSGVALLKRKLSA